MSTFKDFTVNVKKSIDREYDGESNMEPNYDESQKVLNDNVISSIEDSYEDEEYDIVVDADDDISLIEPETASVDMIRLIKVKTINELSKELENVNKTGVPAIIDLKYIQERRAAEYKKLGSTLKAYKSATNANVVLLGSTKNVIVVAPEDIRLLKE